LQAQQLQAQYFGRPAPAGPVVRMNSKQAKQLKQQQKHAKTHKCMHREAQTRKHKSRSLNSHNILLTKSLPPSVYPDKQLL